MVFYGEYNLPKVKDAACLIKFDKYKSIGTHWIALCDNVFPSYDATCFDRFSVEHIPKTQNISKNSYEIKISQEIFI